MTCIHLAKLWTFVIILIAVKHSDAQLRVLTTNIDSTTKTFPFQPINLNTKADVVIGRVRAEDSFDKSAIIEYYLVNVSYLLQDSYQPSTSNRPTPKWQSIAETKTINDCSLSTLSNYPELRRKFCIDHVTGDIKVTKYFNEAPPKSGTTILLKILYKSGARTYSRDISPHSVRIFSSCDRMKQIYINMTKICLLNDVITQNIHTNKESVYTNDISIPTSAGTTYISAISVDLTSNSFITAEGNENPVTFADIAKGRTFIVRVLAGVHNRKGNFTFLGIGTYYVQLDPPIKSSSKLPVLLTFSELALGKVNLKETKISLFSLPVKDFCENGAQCTISANKYYMEYQKYYKECRFEDDYLLYSKYGYCSDNMAPAVSRTTAQIDWDKLNLLRHPQLVMHDYTTGSNVLSYSIKQVVLKYKKNNLQRLNITAHANCTSKTYNVTLPLAYFCINEQTGALYTTIETALVSPDDVFNVTIQVRDTENYPPRIIQSVFSISFKSVCKSTVALYRSVYKQCDKNASLATFSTVSSGTIDLITPSPSGTYYITGLYKRSGLSRQSPSDVGNFIRVRLEDKSDGKVIETKHYNLGRYTAFNRPLLHVDNKKLYGITFTYYNATGKVESIYEYDTTEWGLVIIKKADYCTAGTNCVNLYRKFQQEYGKSFPIIESVCPESDSSAFRTKYGYCNETSAPNVTKTEYDLFINIPYSETEVIPRDQPFYTSGNVFTYDIVKIISHGKLLGGSSRAPITLPTNCTKGYEDSPRKYFCINEKTGRVYTTSAIQGLVDLTTSFVIHVQITDDTSFPIRQIVARLNLKTTDKCAPASFLYQNLSSCVKYSTFSPTFVNTTAIFFRMTGKFQSIISLMFIKQDLQIANKNTIFVISARVYRADGSIQQTATSSSILLSNLSVTADIGLNVPSVVAGSSMEIFFIDHGTGKRINIRADASYSLKFVKEYSCTSCVETYKNWRLQSVVAEKKSGARCTSDPEFYARNFDVCIDPQPSFASSISITSNIVTGMEVRIKNCNYKSPYQFTNSYWLKDGTEKRNASTGDDGVIITKFSALGDEVVDRSTNFPLYKVNDLVINSASITDQGSYQCVIESGSVKVMSETIYLKLTDISETKFTMNIINRKWNEKLKTKASTEFQQLEARLRRIIEDKLDAKECCGPKSNRFIEIDSFSNSSSVVAHGKVLFSSVTSPTRLSYCHRLPEIITDGNFGDLNVQDVNLLNFDCCLATTEGDENFKGMYTFPPTLAGTHTSLNCTYGSYVKGQQIDRKCVFQAETGSKWSSLSLDVCQPKTETTKRLIALSNETITVDNVEVTSSNLSNTVRNGELTNQFDITFISDIITTIIAVNRSNDQVTGNILDTVDSIMEADENLIVAANQQDQTSANILNQLEKLAQTQDLSNTGNLKIINKKHLAMGVINPRQNSPLVFFSGNTGTAEINITQNADSSFSEVSKVVCILPKEVVAESNDEAVYSFVFETDIFFLTTNRNSSGNTSKVHSFILSASVGRRHLENLSVPIELIFTKKVDINGKEKSVCKYWDASLNDSTTRYRSGGWSTRGCTTSIGEHPSQIRCRCNHLTNFALLLDVDQSGSNPLALQIVTWIGCGISLAGLFLTILTFTLFKNLRRKLPPKILINLCISLMAVLIIFLAGAEKTEPRIGCQVVAALLHYFILSTFFWMAVEGLNLYRNFVKVFSGGASNSRFLMNALLFAWGTPLVITAATAGAVSDFLGPASSEDPQFCVLRGTPFYFALIVPICIVMAGNFIVLILVVRGIKDGAKINKESKKEENEKLTQARITFACSVLLGSTWLFAVLAVGDLRDFFQWLFCIFNSLQGLFIFIFYCFRNNEVKRHWRRFLGGQGLGEQSTWNKSKYNSRYTSASRVAQGTSFSRTRSDAKDERRPSNGNTILLRDKSIK